MRRLKFLLILAIGIFISCSSDDDSMGCQEIWGLNRVNDYYEVEYGPDEDNTTTVEVNEETYTYYKAVFEDPNREDCWEGMK